MARRIILAVLALITALLATLAVPLGLLTAAQDRRDFTDETTAAATALANVAEERITDHVRSPALDRSIRDLSRQGDQVAVYDAAGRKLAGTAATPPGGGVVPGSPSPADRSSSTDDRLTVSVPIVPDSGSGSVGTVVLSRSTGPLDHRIVVLWTLIGVVSAAGLLAAAAIAVGLARWASRPLTSLADAARRLGDGALGTRASVGSGPPEIRRLSADFNTMAARLESLVHGHQSMMAEVSHQVRTPLAALRLRLDLLAEDADEATAADVAGAQQEIARLSRLVNGLLAMARAENVTAAPMPVAVHDVVQDRVAAWKPAADERGVALAASCPEPVVAHACEGHLEQILDNLVGNALDALDSGRSIRVGAIAAGGAARVTVADDGQGMSGEQQRAAFRRFASGRPGGTGLGLAIVDRLATANGGSAAMSDTPGGGLTVTIELPLETAQRSGGSGGVSPPRKARPSRRSAAFSRGNPRDLNQF
jgi:signal transduction histidine kinase